MDCLSTVSSWNANEVSRLGPQLGARGERRCRCDEVSAEQRRVQVLEAEAELSRLRDRVRKTVTKWSGGMTLDRPAKRSRTDRTVSSAPFLDLQWKVTPEQLAEHLCFWRHSSALACVNVTDSLKELTARCQEPPESRRALTLVWWNMEVMLQRAWEWKAERTAGGTARPTVVVSIGDILPLFIWEVDLLRVRPETRKLCDRLLQMKFAMYQTSCQPRESSPEQQLSREKYVHFHLQLANHASGLVPTVTGSARLDESLVTEGPDVMHGGDSDDEVQSMVIQ